MSAERGSWSGISRMTHHPTCVAQNANKLFADADGICPAGWPKAAKATRTANPCHGAAITTVPCTVQHYRTPLPFTDSKNQLLRYATHHHHDVPQHTDFDDETGEMEVKESFDDEAMRRLISRYPKDPLYPLIPQWRILKKAKGTYLDAFRMGAPLVGADGRLRDIYKHTPKTLRLAAELLLTLPRPRKADGPDGVYDAIRQCIIPTPGHELCAADFAGIEPLLVAYFAASMVDPTDVSYLRACRLGSHSWVTAAVIGKPVDILTASDEDVLAHFHALEAEGEHKVRGTYMRWKDVRQATKTAHMASLYAGGPGEIARTNPDVFKDTKDARYFQDAFFDLVPIVPKWHWEVARAVDRDGYLLAPSGVPMWGDNTITRKFSKREGKEVERLSRIAKELIAAIPQHTGMMYTATAARALWRERPDLAQWLRLLIHDEIFGEPPVSVADEWVQVLCDIMGRPHERMPLWPEAQAVMGGDTHLRVAVEAKRSKESWGRMR